MLAQQPLASPSQPATTLLAALLTASVARRTVQPVDYVSTTLLTPCM